MSVGGAVDNKQVAIDNRQAAAGDTEPFAVDIAQALFGNMASCRNFAVRNKTHFATDTYESLSAAPQDSYCYENQ